ncbi:unnamed protein product [Parascedosporium putredinis]|uniref:WD40 repeat-like protein n=1 Tax=Parascedosporium putredinis TaxID=1442378 RepID=A0A9P1MEV3_9PEZI|nr:unnamed protein product [Parascedosporium putredinis]CAI8001211.1 unnamed protein product [Parascedosporium putredinis]
MPPREIPGFYYDEARGKYFKIEGRATAPVSAPWSADNVKKRKRAEKAERKRQAAEARTRTTLAGEAKPRPVGRREGAERGDIRASLFCERLKAVGEVVVGEAEEVGWDGDLGRMVMYSQYIPKDAAGRYQSLIVPEFSSINCSPSSHVVFMAGLSNPAAFMTFTWLTRISYASLTDDRPLRGIRQTAPVFQDSPGPASNQLTSYTATLPEQHRSLFCFAGTNRGVLALHTTGDTAWVHQTRSAGDIFSTDCHASDPNLLLAAGRRGIVTLADMRVGPSDGTPLTFTHGSSVTHLRAAPDGNPYRLVVAGLENKMAIYDRRWLARSSRHHSPAGYRNRVRLHIGWDADPSLGLIIAAHDQGSVAVYSAISGHRVGNVPLKPGQKGPVSCVRVGRMGGDDMPSVLVGAGGGILVHSCVSDGEES